MHHSSNQVLPNSGLLYLRRPNESIHIALSLHFYDAHTRIMHPDTLSNLIELSLWPNGNHTNAGSA
jgi:hypothetical protein